MEFEAIRAIFSGLAGGLLAILLADGLSRWSPSVSHRKHARLLIRENRRGIVLANSLFFTGLLFAVAIYHLEFVPRDDWRGLALGVGSGSLAALISLPIPAILQGRTPNEAYVAYAVSQRAPLYLVYGLLTLCVAASAFAINSFFPQHNTGGFHRPGSIGVACDTGSG